MQDLKFPECIYFGELSSSHRDDVPLYLPAKQGGFCLHYDKQDEIKINQLIENITLSILDDIPAGFAKVNIFDFRNRKAFPYLSELKQHNLYSIALNSAQATSLFNQLEETIQHRHHELFTTEQHLDEYNQNSRRKELYHIVIINLDDFPDSQLNTRRIQAFLDSAYSAGFYVIAFSSGETLSDEYAHKANQQLATTLPAIRFHQHQWQMPENTFPLAIFLSAGFQLEPPSLNQNRILKGFKQALNQTDENQEQDFLQVKIGELAGGEPAYFCLGKKSGNYSSLLIGATGKGKSTLMNNLIVQIGEKYTAQEVILYLMDYKQGNEFKSFAKHPNVKYLFTNQDAQSGINLLEELLLEQNRRYAKLTEKTNIRDIDQYNQAYPTDPIPHILLIVDEFQVMFDVDYNEQDKLNSLIRLLAQQGRAAGIHLLLSTQSMRGVSLSHSAKEQLGLRIAYYVDEGALFDVVDNQHRQTVKSLKKYQALFQLSPSVAHTVFVDKPLDIEQSITQIWANRPATQCVIPTIFSTADTQHTKPQQPTSSNTSSSDFNWLPQNQQRSQEELALLAQLAEQGEK